MCAFRASRADSLATTFPIQLGRANVERIIGPPVGSRPATGRAVPQHARREVAAGLTAGGTEVIRVRRRRDVLQIVGAWLRLRPSLLHAVGWSLCMELVPRTFV